MKIIKSSILLSLLISLSAITLAQEQPIPSNPTVATTTTAPRNSIEFTPQISVALFTAQQKVSGTAWGGELIYHHNTENNQMPWIRMLHIKSIDLIFNYKNMSRIKLMDVPDPYKFGDSYAVLAGINITLLKGKTTELDLSPAFGMGYLGETYFTNENPLIGSHLNFASRAGLKVYQNISEGTRLSAGIDILHFSNAGFRVPNNGMNSSNISLGISKSLNTSSKEISDTSRNAWVSRHQYKTHSFDLGIGIGRRGYYRSKEGFFYKTSLYGGYNYRLNPVLGLSAGVDAIYYHSLFDPNNFEATYQSNASSFDRWRVGAALGPDIWMNRLALTVKYGYYLKYNSYKDINTYWTAGLKYNILEWLALQARIHVHKTEADFTAFGLMFTL
jgi:hypothetical protein